MFLPITIAYRNRTSLSRASSLSSRVKAILDEGRVLGPLATRFAVVAHERDDLVRIVGIQRDKSEVVNAVDVSEELGLLLGKLLQGTEEAQIDRLLAEPSVEALEGGHVVGPDKAKRNIDPAREVKRPVFVGAHHPVQYPGPPYCIQRTTAEKKSSRKPAPLTVSLFPDMVTIEATHEGL